MRHSVKKDVVFGDPLSHQALPEGLVWADQLTRSRKPGPATSLSLKDIARGNTCGLANSTLAVHAGTLIDDKTGAVGTPIYQNSTFLLSDEQYTSVEQGYTRDRFIYTRYGNPTQWALQNKLAALEQAESAIVFSSGMAAITASVMALVDKGAHVVASNELYGGTYQLFNTEFPSMGMSASLSTLLIFQR